MSILSAGDAGWENFIKDAKKSMSEDKPILHMLKKTQQQEILELRCMLYVSNSLGPWSCEAYKKNYFLGEHDKSMTRQVLEKFCQNHESNWWLSQATEADLTTFVDNAVINEFDCHT